MARSASATIKGITIEIGGNTTKLLKSLEDVNKKSKDVQSELKGINTLLKFDPQNTELLNQKQVALAEAIENTKNKLEKLKEAEKNVQKQVEEGTINQEQYRDFQREIIATEQDLQKLEKQMKSFGSVTKQQLLAVSNNFEEAGAKMQEVGQDLSKFSIVAGAALLGMTKTVIDFEEAFTGVEKTVDGTTEQLANLKQGIRDMAKEIPSSTAEIASVAEAAGQLGIATDDILEFTRVMIDLGNSTNLSADEAATALAKFANITNMSAKDYSKLGSVVVALGNNFATTEADIVSMATRLAATGELTGLTQSQIMSLATAMSSVGIEAESGGSAMSKLLKKIQVATETGSKDLENFANVAGMTSSQFKQAFEKDAVSALSSFISGLNDAERNGKSAIQILDDMGLTEVRLSNTILSLANSSDLLSSAVELGNSAWEENNALTDEANKRYGTTKSQMQISINKIKDLSISIGNKLLPTIQKGLTFLNKLVDSFSNMSEETQSTILALIGLTAAAAPTVSALGKITSGVGSLINVFAKLTTPSGLIITTLGLLAGTCIAASKDMNTLSEETKKNIDETNNIIKKHQELTETLKNNKKTREEVIKNAEIEARSTEILYQKLVDLESIENKTNAQKELMSELVNQLNEKMPELNLEYDKEKDALNQTTEAIKEQIDAQKDLLKAKVAQSQLNGILEDIVTQEMAIEEAIQNNAKAQEDYNKKVAEHEALSNELLNYAVGSSESIKITKEINKVKKEEKELKKVLDDSNNSLKNQKEELKKLNEEYLSTESYVEKAINTADITKKIQELTNLAKKAGIEIPESLTKGMEEGSVVIPEKIDGLKKLIDFEDVLKSSGLIGEHIPLSLSEGLANGKITVEEAVKEIQAIVDFKNAEDKSQISGLAIPQKLQEGILNGEITVKEAVERANDWIDFQKANQKAIDSGIKIPENLKNGILNGELSVSDANLKMQSWITFNDAVNKAKAAGVDVSESLAENVESGKVKVDVAVQSLNNAISTQLSSTDQMGVDAGGNLIEGVKKGINNKKSSVIKSVTSLGNSMLSALKGALDEHSPSKASEEDAEYLLEGLNVGIKKNKDKVFSNISTFGSDILKTLNNELNSVSTIEPGLDSTKNLMMNMLTNKDSNINLPSNSKDLQNLTSLLDKYMPEVIEVIKANKDVCLDGKKVGQIIAPEINNQLGIITSKTQRGY